MFIKFKVEQRRRNVQMQSTDFMSGVLDSEFETMKWNLEILENLLHAAPEEGRETTVKTRRTKTLPQLELIKEVCAAAVYLSNIIYFDIGFKKNSVLDELFKKCNS